MISDVHKAQILCLREVTIHLPPQAVLYSDARAGGMTFPLIPFPQPVDQDRDYPGQADYREDNT